MAPQKKDSEFLPNSAIESQKTQKLGVFAEILPPVEALLSTLSNFVIPGQWAKMSFKLYNKLYNISVIRYFLKLNDIFTLQGMYGFVEYLGYI